MEEEIKLYCGFCAHQDTYVKKSMGKLGKKKCRGSGTIKCNKCGKNLNQKNTWK
jgi:hypothetical protein